MKKIFNYIISLTLICVMLFNMFSPIAIYAIDNNQPDASQLTANTDVVAKGNIEVETHLVLPIRNREQNNLVFTIYDTKQHSAKIDLNNVNKPKDGYYEENINLGKQNVRVVATERDKNGHLLSGVDYNENVVFISVNLYGLEKGTYTVELSGKYFVTCQAEVTLDNYSKRVILTDEAGMFEIGDINSDGVVDNKDTELMLKAIDNHEVKYDLNLDGVVNIADLNYITAMITNNKGKVKIEDTNAIIDVENVDFALPSGNLASDSGDLSSLFTDEGVVRLEQVGEEPIELDIDFGAKKDQETVAMSEIRIGLGENKPESMVILVEDENGKVTTYTPTSREKQGIHTFTEEVTAGTLKVDLGRQVAVKKVTIRVTGDATNKLADIAKVEFLNNVKVETKEPENFYTPRNVKVNDTVSEQLTVTFEHVPNVTGYEIEIRGGDKNQTFQTTYNTFTIEDLKNYVEYTISVQAVNQEWRSGPVSVKATPKANRKPPAVDMVEATPTFSAIELSWKDMDDTLSYNIYYREVGTTEWQSIKNIENRSYKLTGLKAEVSYEIYITGNNPLGEGSKSQTVTAKTLKASATIVPKYYLINSDKSHIKNVQFTKSSISVMTDDNPWSIVDDDFRTYWSHADWQIAAHYAFNSSSPVIVLDQVYEMDEFVITVPDDYQARYKTGGMNSNDIKVHYWVNDQETYTDTGRTEVRGTMRVKQDEMGRLYYVLKLESPIKAKAVSFGLTTTGANDIKIDEVKFYRYDSLVHDVANLFVDDLRVELREGVGQKEIDALRERANKQDNGEYSPYRDSVLMDLDYAEKILKDEAINDVIVLNPEISNEYNKHLGFAMTISDYQPLGIVARPGDTLNVYVGSTGNPNVQLVYTQYYAEANTWSKTYNLVKGLNTIKIEKIGSATDERGGSVYIRYTSMPTSIKVRVSGGVRIPMVDATLITGESNKKAAIKSYIESLMNYNANLPAVYAAEGKNFDPKLSVLGCTEIVTKYGLFSVSSVAVENALTSGTSSLDERVNRLYESMEAFDEMMELFYRQKGLQVGAQDAKDEMPKARINIRYMRMFDGAFMYAGGYHVGIEYGSIAGLIQANRQSDDKTGYFGWGISHEVGHQINQGTTAFAEVTNNIYALLAQTSNDKDLSRLESSGIYEKIYEKVTSHTKGRAQNVFVQLGMYWQLHIAYDENKTFVDDNSILARINHESRIYNNVNKYGRDDLTILLASKAAKKNLIDFFAQWGLIASSEVTKEIEALGYPKETKALYYLNDKARRYRLANGSAIDNATKVQASIVQSSNQDKRVTLEFNVTANSDAILGYEILRNGESIGFVEGDTHTYIDNIGAENNRAYTYSVVAYDYYLNKTEPMSLAEVKISHDGSVIKSGFSIESNVKEKDEVINYEDEDFDLKNLKVNNLIDGKSNTYFNGTVKYKRLNENGQLVTDSDSPLVIISLNDSLSVSGIKYQAALENGQLLKNTISKYAIYISTEKVPSTDKAKWTKVKEGTFNLTADNNYTDTVYFTKAGTSSESQLWTYNDVGYIMIEAIGNTTGLSGAEIDVIAPPGDNVEIAVDKPNIGVLSEDYCYNTEGCSADSEDIIPKGSVIIQGSYRGSPSFNTILLADADNIKNVYDGDFLIFAELNDDNSVYEVADGTWLYYLTEEQYNKMVGKKIRAYMYRVNDAITLDDQRLTSTSRAIDISKSYADLPSAEIK